MRCDCDDRASVRATPIRPTSASALADPPDLGVSPDRRRRPGGSRVGPGPQPTDDILACVRDVAQSGSAPALGAGGRRFKSARPDQAIRRAGVAQLARASAFQAEGRGFEARLPLQHHLERQALPGADSVPRCRGVRQVVTRARSSAGQSRGLLILRSQVRILPGAPNWRICSTVLCSRHEPTGDLYSVCTRTSHESPSISAATSAAGLRVSASARTVHDGCARLVVSSYAVVFQAHRDFPGPCHRGLSSGRARGGTRW